MELSEYTCRKRFWDIALNFGPNLGETPQTKELSRWCLYKRTSYLKSDNNDMFCFFYGIRVFVCFYCFCFTVLLSVFLLPRDAMHKRGLCVMRCLCVCLSVRLSVKPWSLNSTQLVELSWVESDLALWSQSATRLNSTDPVVTSSVILNIWLCVQLSLSWVVVMITARDRTQLNWTKWPFSRDPVFYFTASVK